MWATLVFNWLSWNQQEILGCILPNYESDTVIINTKLIIHPKTLELSSE